MTIQMKEGRWKDDVGRVWQVKKLGPQHVSGCGHYTWGQFEDGQVVVSWTDSGRWNRQVKTHYDLVEYLGPLNDNDARFARMIERVDIPVQNFSGDKDND